MSFLPLEKQVCTLEQAKELAKLLGEHAQESLWVYCIKIDVGGGKDRLVLELRSELAAYHRAAVPAYTGDELGALMPARLKYSARNTVFRTSREATLHWAYYSNGVVRTKSIHSNISEAHAKAALAIVGLTEGWIKKEEFKFQKEKER